MTDKYSSIIDKPYKKSNRHPHMSILNRSAQFAPFAALTGFDESITETGKILVNKIKISSEKESEINVLLNTLFLDKSFKVKITYFSNIKNNKGEYRNYIGRIKEIDPNNKTIKFEDKTLIKFDNIYDLEII